MNGTLSSGFLEDVGPRTALLPSRLSSERYVASTTTGLELHSLQRPSRPAHVAPPNTDADASQLAEEARRLADDAIKAIHQLKNSLQEDKARAKADENDKDAHEKRHRNSWFP